MIKKNHSQVYLEECKYRAKKIQMSRFINTELSDSESESELKFDFDSDSEYDTVHWLLIFDDFFICMDDFFICVGNFLWLLGLWTFIC